MEPNQKIRSQNQVLYRSAIRVGSTFASWQSKKTVLLLAYGIGMEEFDLNLAGAGRWRFFVGYEIVFFIFSYDLIRKANTVVDADKSKGQLARS